MTFHSSWDDFHEDIGFDEFDDDDDEADPR